MDVDTAAIAVAAFNGDKNDDELFFSSFRLCRSDVVVKRSALVSSEDILMRVNDFFMTTRFRYKKENRRGPAISKVLSMKKK